MYFFDFIRILILMQLLLTGYIFAEKVEITSTNMKTENLKKEVHFIGNAKVKKNQDWIHADKIVVYFDDNNETNMYQALGNVTFEFKNDKGHYKGKSEKITYYPQKSFYILKGESKVDDVKNERQVKGDEITLDMLTGNSQVKGSAKKPVKFIFTTEENK